MDLFDHTTQHKHFLARKTKCLRTEDGFLGRNNPSTNGTNYFVYKFVYILWNCESLDWITLHIILLQHHQLKIPGTE